MTIAADALRAHAVRVLRATGSEEAEAGIVADHLIEANLRGHDSHGVQMIATYVAGVKGGTLFPNRAATTLRDEPPFLHLDGRRGYGHPIARAATERAIAAAKRGGACLLSVRDAGHMGRIGSYGEMVAAAGLAGVFMVNASSKIGWVAPHAGARAILGTNPLCIAAPGPTADEPFVLDMATARIAHGKVRAAHLRGARAPEGALIDAEGRDTTDPAVVFREPMGALLPLGEHKGYGMAVAFEILAGALSGGGTVGKRRRKDGGQNNNLFAVIVDPGRLVDRDDFVADIADVLATMKSNPPRDPSRPVLTAGEPERAMRRRRLAEGIPIDPGTWAAFVASARSVGVELPERI